MYVDFLTKTFCTGVQFPAVPQKETWSGVSAKCGRAEGAQGGQSLKSALRAQANSVGGQNEMETDLSRNCEFVPIFLK